MHNLPPLTELRAFEAAARHLSFKMAAFELNVTPTAISHQIKLLERYCGRTLFRRRPRPLKLTPAGEQLFPVIRDGFQTFADVLANVRPGMTGGRLRITATNAFAARWLVPRLPNWRAAHPRLKVDILGTDLILDLAAGEADIAIRYARRPPQGDNCIELMRDNFRVVASPKLVGDEGKSFSPAELANFPLLEAEWPPTDLDAPNWKRWQTIARRRFKRVPDLAKLQSLAFREELHAIEAAVSGQGIAICSDVLVAPELASGALVQVSKLTLPGYGFYLVHQSGHPKLAAIGAFIAWVHSMQNGAR
ncbi:LysR family transcriptional regulator [Bradyrhizobium sp. LCT2]|uniref:LysR substrate-binding domain-containing protein n=1 Tax=Bradyrhizobium sp. LCT2 TaxID=2493093 RepID=UPI00137385F5|nr:LysR substrate-binding domain-containing protein [Bradyrhizobium sp. LCT2]QHP68121.1 LysR family transcriptional regulator [Bradyrhizobium sp. LCT2]